MEDPEDFLNDLVQAAKPGGRIIVAVPLIPSRRWKCQRCRSICPPHHLTFWTMPALAHTFGKFGLKVLNHQAVPPGPAESFLFWAGAFPGSGIRTGLHGLIAMLWPPCWQALQWPSFSPRGCRPTSPTR